MRITPPYSAPPAAATLRGRRRAGDFSVLDRQAGQESPGAGAAEADPGGEATAPATVNLTALQAAQPGQAEAPPQETDRQASRHGRAMLGALAGLQLASLGGDRVAARRTLADLARALPAGASPGLDAILQAIAQRAAVELARSDTVS
jgi:hypothetical protein